MLAELMNRRLNGARKGLIVSGGGGVCRGGSVKRHTVGGRTTASDCERLRASASVCSGPAPCDAVQVGGVLCGHDYSRFC